MSLTDAQRETLIAAAHAVQENAYCPYSKFAVGAALLDDQGAIHLGVNVENAAYPVGVCAERSAISAAITAGARGMVAIALVTPAATPVAPCGMCRQALSEFNNDMVLLLTTREGDVQEMVLRDTLPHQFDPKHLEA